MADDKLAKYRGPDGKILPRSQREGGQALVPVNRNTALGSPLPARPAAGSREGHAGEVADLPRICAVHDRPYAARYIRGNDGRFRHAQSVKVTETLYLGQYADGAGQKVLVDADDIAEETCPWCGASGRGAVNCKSCGYQICFGRTTGRYFRCRESCPGQGTMVPYARTETGVTPRQTRTGGYRVPGKER